MADFFSFFSLDHGESLTEKFDEVSEKIITELILIKPKQQFIAKSVQAKNKYDIFVSYPTKNAEIMKVVYEILHKHNPQWKIFYDKLELKTGKKKRFVFLIFIFYLFSRL